VLSFFIVSETLEGARFLYLATVGWAALLTAMAFATPRPLWRVVAVGAIATAGAFGVREHLKPWAQAAAVRDAVIEDLRSSRIVRDCDRVALLDVPDSVQGAYVFRNGMAEAAQAMNVSITSPDAAGPCVFRWSGDHFQPR
jgi:hypothetical protein